MIAFESVADAIAAIVRFDRERFGAFPEPLQAHLDRLAGVDVPPVDRIVFTAEALFANRKALTRKADRELVAALMDFAGRNGWHGANVDDRATRIAAAMRQKNGEPGVEIAEEKVPAPLRQFIPEDAS